MAIGRDGELLKYFHGHHRLAMAQILDVDRVVVTVGVVHHLWVQDCIRRFGGSPLSAIRAGLVALAGNIQAADPSPPKG